MIIERMNATHVPQIAELEKVCFADPWSVTSIETELSSRLSLWFVAMEGDTVVGYVGSQTVIDESDVMNIAVHPDYRRQGIGEALLETLADALREKGSRGLTLEARVSNTPAVSLYKKAGFLQVGLRKYYYRNPKEDALILRKELEK